MNPVKRNVPSRAAMRLVPVLFSVMLLSGCATAAVTGAVVGAAATTTKIAAKTTVGAGKLVYKGTKAAVKGTASLVTSNDEPPSPN